MRHVTHGSALTLFAAGCALAVNLAPLDAQSRTGDAVASLPAGVQSSTLSDGSVMLTDAKGMTLYTYLKDTPRESNCNDACAKQWPPLAATGTPPNELWTVITRIDGSRQWAYRGRPLYGWIKDTKPGDLSGEGIAGAWKIAAVGIAPNLVKIHLAHVATAFEETPNRQSLLATAVAEAKIAAQHAALAARAGNNLEAMKLHAGHVIHAIDPNLEPTGPGLGFGVRRAAAGVVEHVQLASNVTSATNDVLTVAFRVLASANNTVKRADEIVSVAGRVRTAATAAEAASDVTRLSVLVQQLMTGVDVNKDGHVGWQSSEGGLEQVQAQVQLMIKSAGS